MLNMQEHQTHSSWQKGGEPALRWLTSVKTPLRDSWLLPNTPDLLSSAATATPVLGWAHSCLPCS